MPFVADDPPLLKRTRSPKGQGKQVLNFRCTPELVKSLRQASKARGMSVTDYIVQCVRWMIDSHGVPPTISAALRREREVLGFDEFEYAHFMCFMRASGVRKKGPAFDMTPASRRNLELRRQRTRG
jgi:hypothetical protein